ncbi:alpha/beta fold hydrolase [Aquincola tertiaricarbonis]|uniref:alpha/beta fold hydrolase n=1 Tax=Aquincola tertiaricarbonis TaxID=391953 RepID=UPI0006152609|nr:alpha/beta hydrolase [Aquincola tertiaricarbonis]
MTGTRFAELAWQGRTVRIEHQWLRVDDAAAPLMVFLHEGLGSVAMWKDFPQRLCDALGVRGLVFSRPGYGRSTPRAADERWAPDFMHRQAHELLPALFDALRIDTAGSPPWLFGHSDGGSIALLHAARHRTAGAIVLAPHLFVEDLSITSIEGARQAWLTTDLPQRLGRYHDDADSAFWGWNRIWLDPAFRGWNIEHEVAQITAPVLAIQGIDDEYGTLEQVRSIRRLLPATQLLALPDCGHSPHRDQPAAVIAAARGFLQDHHRPHDTRGPR